MMTEFTKTKMHFALGMIGTLFALHPLVERYPDLGFDYQVLQWSVSLKMIYAYALLGGLLALCVYCYGVALMGQHSSWVERLGNFSYAVAILTPPLYGMLYLSTFLSKSLEAEHLQWLLTLSEEEKKRRLLLRLACRVNGFFGRFPRLERRLSNLTHTVWANYRKLKG